VARRTVLWRAEFLENSFLINVASSTVFPD
jgi:hypothetical protein